MENNDIVRGLGIGFLAGAMVGVAIGLIYAPRSGRETRTMITERADELREKVSEATDMVKDKVASMHRKAPG